MYMVHAIIFKYNNVFSKCTGKSRISNAATETYNDDPKMLFDRRNDANLIRSNLITEQQHLARPRTACTGNERSKQSGVGKDASNHGDRLCNDNTLRICLQFVRDALAHRLNTPEASSVVPSRAPMHPSPATGLLRLAAVVAVLRAVASAGGRRTVLYAKSKSGGLACYQHSGTDGGAFWTYADDRQRRPYMFHCPSSLSTWCVNAVTGPVSVRGCSGPTGVNRAGCFHVVDPKLNDTSKVCLCNRNYCNRAVTATAAAAAGTVAASSSFAFFLR